MENFQPTFSCDYKTKIIMMVLKSGVVWQLTLSLTTHSQTIPIGYGNKFGLNAYHLSIETLLQHTYIHCWCATKLCEINSKTNLAYFFLSSLLCFVCSRIFEYYECGCITCSRFLGAVYVLMVMLYASVAVGIVIEPFHNDSFLAKFTTAHRKRNKTRKKNNISFSSLLRLYQWVCSIWIKRSLCLPSSSLFHSHPSLQNSSFFFYSFSSKKTKSDRISSIVLHSSPFSMQKMHTNIKLWLWNRRILLCYNRYIFTHTPNHFFPSFLRAAVHVFSLLFFRSVLQNFVPLFGYKFCAIRSLSSGFVHKMAKETK